MTLYRAELAGFMVRMSETVGFQIWVCCDCGRKVLLLGIHIGRGSDAVAVAHRLSIDVRYTLEVRMTFLSGQHFQ